MKQFDEPHLFEKVVMRLVWIAFFIIAMVAFGTMTSCRAKKETIDTTVISDSQSRDSSNVREINKAIDDKTSLYIPPVKTPQAECDSLCDEAVKNILKGLNFTKQSGSNEYSLLYNENTRLLTLLAKMGETKSETIKVTKVRTKTITRTITKKIPVRYVPDWIKWFAMFGGLSVAGIIAWLIYKAKTIWLPKKLPTV